MTKTAGQARPTSTRPSAISSTSPVLFGPERCLHKPASPPLSALGLHLLSDFLSLPVSARCLGGTGRAASLMPALLRRLVPQSMCCPDQSQHRHTALACSHTRVNCHHTPRQHEKSLSYPAQYVAPGFSTNYSLYLTESSTNPLFSNRHTLFQVKKKKKGLKHTTHTQFTSIVLKCTITMADTISQPYQLRSWDLDVA